MEVQDQNREEVIRKRVARMGLNPDRWRKFDGMIKSEPDDVDEGAAAPNNRLDQQKTVSHVSEQVSTMSSV